MFRWSHFSSSSSKALSPIILGSATWTLFLYYNLSRAKSLDKLHVSIDPIFFLMTQGNHGQPSLQIFSLQFGGHPILMSKDIQLTTHIVIIKLLLRSIFRQLNFFSPFLIHIHACAFKHRWLSQFQFNLQPCKRTAWLASNPISLTGSQIFLFLG